MCLKEKCYYVKLFFLFLTFLIFQEVICPGQVPAPAMNIHFSLPLADQTTSVAVLLPTQDGQAWLVYATNSGKLASFYLTPTRPGPSPIPPIPPDPVPQKLTIVVVEDPTKTTVSERLILSDSTWRDLANLKHDFKGVIPFDIKEKKTGLPPPALVPFLERSKLHKLPWLMFTNAQGIFLWEGNLPDSRETLISLIRKHGG